MNHQDMAGDITNMGECYGIQASTVQISLTWMFHGDLSPILMGFNGT
jgi:hypothetical protein